MSAGDWVLNIVLFILAIGSLICIHELGHLIAAKLFGIYCREFSIGFGPRIFKKKRKKGETYFSLRAFPLGGYVSMYDEPVEDENGVMIPKERSLEGIRKWKKAIIVASGVVMNVLMAFFLIAVSDICFPLLRATRFASVVPDSPAAAVGIKDDDSLYFFGPERTAEDSPDEDPKRIYFEYKEKSTMVAGYAYVIDPHVTISKDGSTFDYVLTYFPTGNKKPVDFVEGMALHPAYAPGTAEADEVKESYFKAWTERGYDVDYENADGYYPDFTRRYSPEGEGVSFAASIGFNRYLGKSEEGTPIYEHVPSFFDLEIGNERSGGKYRWKSFGLLFRNEKMWLPFWTRARNTFVDFGNASKAIFVGLGELFKGNIENIAGIVGILNQSATIYTNYAFSLYLYFWGLISVNLAILNLMPFPGLDGWSLLVTGIEGASRKKIPPKVKNIVSLVGLGILSVFMVVIIIIDALRWGGIM